MDSLLAKARSYNPAHVFLVAGLVASLLLVMFRPGGADASLPSQALVFEKYDATTPATVNVKDIKPVENVKYQVIPRGKTAPVEATFSGTPLIEYLKKANVALENVNFVRVRLGSNDDSVVSLVALDQESTSGRPPLLLDTGRIAGRGAFNGPRIVPGQPTDAPIHETHISSVLPKGSKPTFIPAQPGARIMSVRVKAQRKKNGELKLTARVTAGGSGGGMKYTWYGFDSQGNSSVVSSTSTYTTSDATSGTAKHQVNVIVTETGTGSTGVGGYGYTSKKKNDGAKRGPTSSTGRGNGGGGTGTGTGGGTGNNGVFPNANSTPSPTPGFSTPSPSVTTPPPVQQQPTAPTTVPDVPVQSDVDTSAITNVAQNVSGTGGLQTVSGVLLSSPTVAPSGGGGGAPLAELPDSVATVTSSVFQPVEDPGDIWPYLITILFATCIAGAVREWVNP